ncbi:MAG: HAD family phosphatase [candidate division KSB1 bacterium]|nr:HAD family phosphatase [candidate division KSB1 bacterium]MDQ7064792.1 HAD family phosphatase [candidate division KSB1 bacterium]
MKTINDPGNWLRRFSAVIFDFDGVIVDSEVLQARAWEQLARELGHDDLRVSAAQIAGRLDSQIARDLFGAEVDVAFCLQRKVVLQEALEARGELRFIPGVLELLPALHRTHTLAICSNSYEDRVEAFLKQHNLRRWFRVVVGYRDGLAPKPSPQPYVRTLQRLGMAADGACAIEDSPPGIEAAKQAGLFAIQLVRAGIEPSPLADVHITDYAQLRQDEGVIR